MDQPKTNKIIMNNTSETGHGTGAIVDSVDDRDFKWGEQIGDASVSFDWSVGYDVEEELSSTLGIPGFKLKVEDQNGSFSCGGQAVSKKGEVASAFHNKSYVDKSAKFPYSQCFVGTGGSGARPLFDIYNKQGMGNESDTPSYDQGNPPAEPFMERSSDITADARNNAVKDKSAGYAQVNNDIDSIAQAIRDGKGVVIGIYGQNNGTWRTSYPTPPTSNNVWAHWVYAGKAKIVNGKKYIGFLNSWGPSTGDNGWQWISEDYFNAQWGIFMIWNFVYDTHTGEGLFTRTLRYGMTGDDVKKLQEILKITPDGIFKYETLNHVKLFQTLHNLSADGIVGPKTQKILETITI